jgi:hypothetical protein
VNGSTKRPSLRAAINAMCRSCIYDPVAGRGNWRQQVTACTATSCALFRIRPVSMPERELDSTIGRKADSELVSDKSSHTRSQRVRVSKGILAQGIPQ